LIPIQTGNSPAAHSERRNVELWNALLSYAGQPLAIDDTGYSFEFTAAPPPDATRHSLLVQSDVGPHFVVMVTSFPFKAMFNAEIDVGGITDLPPALRACIEEGIVATLWAALPSDRMGDFRILGSGPLDQITTQTQMNGLRWLSITVIGATPEPIEALIALPVAEFIDGVLRGTLAPAALERSLRSRLTHEANYTVGQLTLRIDALGRLACGDAVVLAESSPELARVRVDRFRFTFQPIEDGWLCIRQEAQEHLPETRKVTTFMGEMSDDTNTEHAVLSALNIAIDFDLGRITVPLTEIETWQPGTIVSLDPPPVRAGAEVTIRANGQVIGTGDLVRVDDRFAVLITRLMYQG